MTKTYWTTILIALAITAAVLGNQQMAIATLREKAATLQLLVEDGPTEPTVSSLIPNHKSVKNRASLGSDAPSAPFLETKRKLEAWTKEFEAKGDTNSPIAAIQKMNELLDSVGDLSIEELLDLAATFPGYEEEQLIQMMLVAIAAEHDPQRILNDPRFSNEDIRMSAISALARKDPEAARQWFEQAQLEPMNAQRAGTIVSLQLVRSNTVAGLNFLKSLPNNHRRMSMGGLSVIMKDPLKRKEIENALGNESDAALKMELGLSLVAGTMKNDGIPSARQSLKALKFSKGDHGRIVSELSRLGMEVDPEASISWIFEEASPDTRPKMLARAVRVWAKTNFNAAGKWIGALEASPEKDEAASSFASAIAPLDPESAIHWAQEIKNESLRENAVKQVLNQWKEIDAQAASTWSKEHGMP